MSLLFVFSLFLLFMRYALWTDLRNYGMTVSYRDAWTYLNSCFATLAKVGYHKIEFYVMLLTLLNNFVPHRHLCGINLFTMSRDKAIKTIKKKIFFPPYRIF